MYLKAKPTGGKLIRRVIKHLKDQGLKLPLEVPLYIAVSGGSDSVGLAHLVVHLGRKIVTDRTKISLIHVNHRWRGSVSDLDEQWVIQLGKHWGVDVRVHQLDPNLSQTEEVARTHRKKIFKKILGEGPGLLMTGHQGDDLAETVLWRLCTGAAQTHGGGIGLLIGQEIRPFLTTRKSEIVKYLGEVGQNFRTDSTNFSSRYLRGKMRLHLMPTLEEIFPQAIRHLVDAALLAQKEESQIPGIQLANPVMELLRAKGIKARRPHWDFVLQQNGSTERSGDVIHLPDGWQLTRVILPTEKWIFRKNRRHSVFECTLIFVKDLGILEMGVDFLWLEWK